MVYSGSFLAYLARLNCTSAMKILFFSDDPDDSTIFIDTITGINPQIDCTIIASNENAFAAIGSSAATIVFLDYHNLPERFAKNFIKLMRDDHQRKNIKVVVYVSRQLLTKEISEQLLNGGLNEFVFKTSDMKVLHKSIADALR
jgi:hypothetical protein